MTKAIRKGVLPESTGRPNVVVLRINARQKARHGDGHDHLRKCRHFDGFGTWNLDSCIRKRGYKGRIKVSSVKGGKKEIGGKGGLCVHQNERVIA